MPKPVQIMRGGFSNRIYAVRRYRAMGDGLFRVVGDNKDDVTAQAIQAVYEHVGTCETAECGCRKLLEAK